VRGKRWRQGVGWGIREKKGAKVRTTLAPVLIDTPSLPEEAMSRDIEPEETQCPSA
jgi:hypothetical protein